MKPMAVAKAEKSVKGDGKTRLRSIEVEMAKNGGHVVRHRFENNGPNYKEPEEYVFGDGQGHEALAHIAKHAGIESASEEKGEKESKGKGDKEEEGEE